jgi:hypothetical protein
MDKNNIAIKNPDITCCNCLMEGKVHNIHIGAMGYGSGFDNMSTQINLCDDCYNKTNHEWWKLKRVPTDVGYEGDNHTFYKYEFENEIFNYVKQLPLVGKELFWNRYSYGAYADCNMDSQDWIDYELDILPHQKCKEYDIYSPQEQQAYKDRFPNCKHVKIQVYDDESKSSKCINMAWGDADGNCGSNMSDKCYMCEYFEERNGEIKTVDVLQEFYKRETERLNNIIAYATKRLEMIKNKTLTEED